MGQSMNGPSSAVSESDDPPELRRARELLSSVSTDSITDRELERLHGAYASPGDSVGIVPPQMPMMHDPMNDLNRYPVYPVGQTVGIDPFHSDHIHKIPYSLPDSAGAVLADAPVSQPLVNPATPTTAGQMDKPNSLWGAKKPNVFLVEDDPTCAKIGVKFLKSMGCEVEHAVSFRHWRAENTAKLTLFASPTVLMLCLECPMWQEITSMLSSWTSSCPVSMVSQQLCTSVAATQRFRSSR